MSRGAGFGVACAALAALSLGGCLVGYDGIALSNSPVPDAGLPGSDNAIDGGASDTTVGDAGSDAAAAVDTSEDNATESDPGEDSGPVTPTGPACTTNDPDNVCVGCPGGSVACTAAGNSVACDGQDSYDFTTLDICTSSDPCRDTGCDSLTGQCRSAAMLDGVECGLGLTCSGGVCGGQDGCRGDCDLACSRSVFEMGERCVMDCDLSQSCAAECQGADDCAISCRQGGGCELSCLGNPRCAVDCTGAEDCNVQCAGGTCDVDCTGAASCAVDCNSSGFATAACVLDCGDNAEDCGFLPESCPLPTDCGNGIFVCNRGCP